MRKSIAKALAWASSKVNGQPALPAAAPVIAPVVAPEVVAPVVVAPSPSLIERWANYNKQFCQVAWTHQSRAGAGDHYNVATHAARLVLPPPPPGAPPRPRGLNPDHIVCDGCAEWAKRKGGWSLERLPSVPKSVDLGTAIEGPSNALEDVENTTAAGAD